MYCSQSQQRIENNKFELSVRSLEMDFQNRVGSAPGAGGLLTQSETNAERRERLRKLALEMIDLEKDPYFMRNHLGTYECRLCLTIHTNEGNYLAHTQGKKHQANLARRAAREASENAFATATSAFSSMSQAGKPRAPRIGRPGYNVVKIRHPTSLSSFGYLIQIQYPDVGINVTPEYRFLSAFEQKIDPPNKNFQYLVFVAEPYESIAFKISSFPIDRENLHYVEYWDPVAKQFSLQFLFNV